MNKHRSFRLTLPSGPYQFSLGSLFRLQTAIAGILGLMILSQDYFGGTCAVVFAMIGYDNCARSLAPIPRALFTVAVAGIGSALAARGSAIEVLVSGLAGSLIGAFVFLGLYGKAEKRTER